MKLFILKIHRWKGHCFYAELDFGNVEYSVMNIEENADEEVKKEYTEEILMEYAIKEIRDLL